MTELWAPVLLNGGIFKDNYLVSNMGRVKHRHVYKNGNCRFVLVNVINSRRPVVKMTGDGKQYNKSLAKLVLSSFQWRDGCECANITYLDGNMKNCCLSNLRYTADKGVYTAIELENKMRTEIPRKKKKIRTKRSSVVKTKMNDYGQPISCKTCGNPYCKIDISNFSTDFGAEGCRQYKPKQT